MLMTSKTKAKAQPRGKILPSEAPLLAIRHALLADFRLVSGVGIRAKAVEELRTAMRLTKDLQPSPSRDEIKMNTALAHVTNAVILAIGSPEGRIWLEQICCRRGLARRTGSSLLLLAFKAFGPYDRSLQKRRQSDKYASDDARGMLNALAVEKKLPLQLATEVFTIPGKGRSSFYRPKGASNSIRKFIDVSPTHRDRISKRPAGAKGLGLLIRTKQGARLSGVILDPKKIAAILAYAKTLNE
jgi:hypothetical protein